MIEGRLLQVAGTCMVVAGISIGALAVVVGAKELKKQL